MRRKHKNITIIAYVLVVFSIAYLVISQIITLQKAHSTFENYYAFRGCMKLLERTSAYGLCKLPSGHIIKIVEFRGKWYLDNDLPVCIGNVCL